MLIILGMLGKCAMILTELDDDEEGCEAAAAAAAEAD